MPSIAADQESHESAQTLHRAQKGNSELNPLQKIAWTAMLESLWQVRVLLILNLRAAFVRKESMPQRMALGNAFNAQNQSIMMSLADLIAKIAH